jgi:hypothetical protein
MGVSMAPATQERHQDTQTENYQHVNRSTRSGKSMSNRSLQGHAEKRRGWDGVLAKHEPIWYYYIQSVEYSFSLR